MTRMRVTIARVMVIFIVLALLAPATALAQQGRAKPQPRKPIYIAADGKITDETGHEQDFHIFPFASKDKSGKKPFRKGMATKRPPVMYVPAELLKRPLTPKELAVSKSYLAAEKRRARISVGSTTAKVRRTREFTPPPPPPPTPKLEVTVAIDPTEQKLLENMQVGKVVEPTVKVVIKGIAPFDKVPGEFTVPANQVNWTSNNPSLIPVGYPVAPIAVGSAQLIATVKVGDQLMASKPITVTILAADPTGLQKIKAWASAILVGYPRPVAIGVVVTAVFVFLILLAIILFRKSRSSKLQGFLNNSQSQGQVKKRWFGSWRWRVLKALKSRPRSKAPAAPHVPLTPPVQHVPPAQQTQSTQP